MAEASEPFTAVTRRQSSLAIRLKYAGWVLAVTAALLALLIYAGRLPALEALLVFIAIALAAMLAPVPERRVYLPPATNEISVPAPVVTSKSRIPFLVDAQLAALISALPEPALLIDRRGTVLVGNGPAVTNLGPVRKGDPMSLSIRIPEVIDAFRAAVTEGKTRSVQFTERIPGGRAMEAHVVPLELNYQGREEGGTDAVLVTFRDLTEQHRVDRMRADFVANASHELRTPLASLSGFIETLQGPAREDVTSRDKFLGIMVEQARRMSRLIDDLLSLSRIELSAHLRPQTVIDLVPIVTHVCETLSPLARDRGVKLDIQKKTEVLNIRADRDDMIRLFENLVENGLKYGASGKRVEVTIGEEAGDAVVSVRDFGPGIAEHHLPRLTERFYRVNVETSRAEGGTGLGLAIVKHILARHRGRLAIDSELGKGAIFSARIPLSTSSLADS